MVGIQHNLFLAWLVWVGTSCWHASTRFNYSLPTPDIDIEKTRTEKKKGTRQLKRQTSARHKCMRGSSAHSKHTPLSNQLGRLQWRRTCLLLPESAWSSGRARTAMSKQQQQGIATATGQAMPQQQGTHVRHRRLVARAKWL